MEMTFGKFEKQFDFINVSRKIFVQTDFQPVLSTAFNERFIWFSIDSDNTPNSDLFFTKDLIPFPVGACAPTPRREYSVR